MKIKIGTKEITENDIPKACLSLSKKCQQETELGNRVRQIAVQKNIATGDMIEAIVSHIIYTDNDFIIEIEN